jgi:hypothetical protein
MIAIPAIVCLLALLAVLAVAHVRQGWRLEAMLCRLAAAEVRADRWRDEAARWRTEATQWHDAHDRLAAQQAADVDAAIAQAEAVTREARRVLPAPADLDQVEQDAWAEIINHYRSDHGA